MIVSHRDLWGAMSMDAMSEIYSEINMGRKKLFGRKPWWLSVWMSRSCRRDEQGKPVSGFILDGGNKPEWATLYFCT